MRDGMTEWKPARNGLLLQTLESALAFFATEGSERPFRSECHLSLHLRGSGIPQALAAGNFIPLRCAWQQDCRRCSRRTLKRNLTIAKANEPSAP